MRWFLIASLALVLVLDIGFGRRIAHYDIEGPAEHHKEGYEQRAIEGPFVIGLKDGARWFLELADANDKAITALSTLAIAVFTVVLAWATIGLWNMASAQADDMKESLRTAKIACAGR